MFRRRVIDALGGTRVACLLGVLFCWRLVLQVPAPPLRRAHGLDPPVVRMSGFWIRQVPLFRLHKVSFACAAEDTSRMVVFVALDGKMGSYLLGTRLAADPLFAARPASLRPAALRRPATPR